MVEGARLERGYRATYRGFESLPLCQNNLLHFLTDIFHIFRCNVFIDMLIIGILFFIMYAYFYKKSKTRLTWIFMWTHARDTCKSDALRLACVPIKILANGYIQDETARHLGLSTAMVSKVLRANDSGQTP